MSNMSYVRWENTLRDLEDCQEHVEDTDLSESEERSRLRLMQVAKAMLMDFEAQFGEVDPEW